MELFDVERLVAHLLCECNLESLHPNDEIRFLSVAWELCQMGQAPSVDDLRVMIEQQTGRDLTSTHHPVIESYLTLYYAIWLAHREDIFAKPAFNLDTFKSDA